MKITKWKAATKCPCCKTDNCFAEFQKHPSKTSALATRNWLNKVSDGLADMNDMPLAEKEHRYKAIRLCFPGICQDHVSGFPEFLDRCSSALEKV